MTVQMYSNQNGVDDETVKKLLTWLGEVFSSHALLFKWCLRAAKDFLLLLLSKASFTGENDNNNVNGAGDDIDNEHFNDYDDYDGAGGCGDNSNGGENEDDKCKNLEQEPGQKGWNMFGCLFVWQA